jgi:Gnt-I system high-affinity gluconate transporter
LYWTIGATDYCCEVQSIFGFFDYLLSGRYQHGNALELISKSIQKGIGDMLGSLVGVIALGLCWANWWLKVAAQRIASVMMGLFGEKYIQWGLVCTGFIIGIPLFYNVGL